MPSLFPFPVNKQETSTISFILIYVDLGDLFIITIKLPSSRLALNEIVLHIISASILADNFEIFSCKRMHYF